MVNREKVTKLYSYIKDLSSLKMHIVTDMDKQIWSYPINDIPGDDENITLFYRDRVENEASTGDVILEVRKPEFQLCPNPDKVFEEWLTPGWDRFSNEVNIKNNLIKTEEGQEDKEIEYFQDNPLRVQAFEKWLIDRNAWAEKQKNIDRTRKIFTLLYKLHTDLELDSETVELIIGNGYLKDKDNPTINHPLLLKRVKTSFEAKSNVIRIHDTEKESELYTILLQEIKDINRNAINSLKEELHINDYHPLDRHDAYEFLKKFVHQLSSEGKFARNNEESYFGAGDRLLLSIKPVFFVRKRIDGAIKSIEQIIDHIKETGYIPPHLIDIVDGGVIDVNESDREITIEDQLAAVGGEDTEILLSKEANKEQLEIAQRIENYNAVLVQGPPGTGKTHTIANLLGHFLAQGKNILVTSHTKKALSVLKEKVTPGLQNLCVSVLDDSNIDMERSVDGISDYLSKYTSRELKKKMNNASRERSKIISSLAEVRKQIYAIKYREFEPIVYNGTSISTLEAAKFVNEFADSLSYIPGKVKLYHPLPVTVKELSALYRSNESVTTDEELELANDLPNPELIFSPIEFSELLRTIASTKLRIKELSENNGFETKLDYEKKEASFSINDCKFVASSINRETIHAIKSRLINFQSFEQWMVYAVVDGRKGGVYKELWETLISQIRETTSYAESLVQEQFGKSILFAEQANLDKLFTIISKMQDLYNKKGRISWLSRKLNRSFEMAMEAVKINNCSIASASDCELVLHQIDLINKRRHCAEYWDQLLASHGAPKFEELNAHEPESIASNYIDKIQRYLKWYSNEYKELSDLLGAIGIKASEIFAKDALDSEIVATEKILSAIVNVLPAAIDVCENFLDIRECNDKISQALDILTNEKCGNSKVCYALALALNSKDQKEYETWFQALASLYPKYELQKIRYSTLAKISAYAAEWAEAIKNRHGVHGQSTVPSDIEDAWKWKQYAGIISEITSLPFEELQKKSMKLSKCYREQTADLAELSAWYYLLQKTERNLDMKQALQGWKLTVRRIGKGTGKNAPMLKAEARKLMAKCQEAVPVWIMPVNKALESLDPRVNQFDVIIVDEASQSDISALAIIYMGKKIIIVGDDQQVSPMAVGVDIDRMNALSEMHIKDLIPNWHLYNVKSSLYDIAGTTFQPLMLREHFRCVPEIIGFSNRLSYDYKIKPLRDTSDSTIFPSVVNYRVDDGERNSNKKINRKEAETILALIVACMEQPEYEGKTFGVISLLGDEQAELIRKMILERIDPTIIEARRILCGNASHFQGDERDIIFLSMVDSNPNDGPLKLMGYGVDDANKKRYNVAASRAKDQLWVVHSLDISKDLKSGDLRRDLLEYSLNAKAYIERVNSVEVHAESPFEVAVGKALVARGYNIIQQWQVGAYRIDMVAVCGNKKVAIECDGDKYHSGEDKVREDMERQTILERLGWRFIRIRGSEYYRNPNKTMERVVSELSSFDILPDMPLVQSNEVSSNLLSRTKIRAAQLLNKWNEDNTDLQGTDSILELALSGDKSLVNEDKMSIHVIDGVLQTESKITSETSKQLSLFEVPLSRGKVVEDKTHPVVKSKSNISKRKEKRTQDVSVSSSIFEYLHKNNLEYIDNSSTSSLIWVFHTPDTERTLTEIKETFGIKIAFERRGAKATNNKPAWRIIL